MQGGFTTFQSFRGFPYNINVHVDEFGQDHNVYTLKAAHPAISLVLTKCIQRGSSFFILTLGKLLARKLVSCKPFDSFFHIFWLDMTWLHGLPRPWENGKKLQASQVFRLENYTSVLNDFKMILSTIHLYIRSNTWYELSVPPPGWSLADHPEVVSLTPDWTCWTQANCFPNWCQGDQPGLSDQPEVVPPMPG